MGLLSSVEPSAVCKSLFIHMTFSLKKVLKKALALADSVLALLPTQTPQVGVVFSGCKRLSISPHQSGCLRFITPKDALITDA